MGVGGTRGGGVGGGGGRAAGSATHVLILYTTLYRTGGAKFVQAARTLASEKWAEHPDLVVTAKAVESKSDFLAAFAAIAEAGGTIEEFHFIGHSGVYGIMFGTVEWPEQLSPYEWRQARLPFAPGARVWFHACRTGRWFAAFFARTFRVTAYGHFWYTTVSRSPRAFRWQGFRARPDEPLYVISCPGRKSHGLFGSAFKYSGFSKAIPMLEFSPTDENVDTSYDSVAALYDQTFEEIGVRRDEWRWLVASLGDAREKRVLDLGCGTGAFLGKLGPGLASGVGADISEGMLEHARARWAGQSNLSFVKLDGPRLPFEDDSFDTVLSILSFRYLDWDPVIHEILRVLKPGGELLLIDMVAAPVRWRQLPRFLRDKARTTLQRLTRPGYFRALRRMVTDRRWQTMLKYNPMRAEHEYTWYLESRFPGRRTEILNVGWSSRILAFRSGPLAVKSVARLQYP